MNLHLQSSGFFDHSDSVKVIWITKILYSYCTAMLSIFTETTFENIATEFSAKTPLEFIKIDVHV